MRKFLWLLVAGVFAWSNATSAATDRDLLREAQKNLKALGYSVTTDGKMGAKTKTALTRFLETRGVEFGGDLTPDQAALIAKAAAPIAFVPAKPGVLFETALGREKKCFGMRLSGNHRRPSLPPFPAFEGMPAFGDTAQSMAFFDLQNFLVTRSSFAAATGDERAANEVKAVLLEWARAGAALETVVDLRNLGAGKGKASRADAPGFFRNVELAMDLGWSAITAASLIRDRLSPEEFKTVHDWYTQLITIYSGARVKETLRGDTNGIFKLLNGLIPAVALAAVDGDEVDFRKYAEAGLKNLQKHLTIDGYYLKNINRGGLALHLQGFGILYTLTFAEILHAQGVDIYPRIQDRLHRAVTFFLDVDRDNSLIVPFAKEAFNSYGSDPRKQEQFHREAETHFWWMMVYAARFPDDANSPRLRTMLRKYRESREDLAGRVQATNWEGISANCFYDWSGPDAPPEPVVIPKGVEVHTIVDQVRRTNSQRVEADLRTQIVGAAASEETIAYRLTGLPAAGKFFLLRFDLAVPIPPETVAALDPCKAMTTSRYPDGTDRALITFKTVTGDFVAQETECVFANLPPQLASQAKYLTTQFKEIASGMIAAGTVKDIPVDELRDWLDKVATGKIVVR